MTPALNGEVIVEATIAPMELMTRTMNVLPAPSPAPLAPASSAPARLNGSATAADRPGDDHAEQQDAEHPPPLATDQAHRPAERGHRRDALQDIGRRDHRPGDPEPDDHAEREGDEHHAERGDQPTRCVDEGAQHEREEADEDAGPRGRSGT